MGFEVGADSYQQFMGRYADRLAPLFADLAGVSPGQRVLDVGCGPGALTAVLVERVGDGEVAAVDPSPPFVAATRQRLPSAEVQQARAESLPFTDGRFDTALAQLVVHFMTDPVQGLREMARVTVPGGTVAACVWDHAGGRGPLATFWTAVAWLRPDHPGESQLAGTRAGELADLFGRAGLSQVEETGLTVSLRFADVDAWWAPYTMGVGPAGDHVAALTDRDRDELRRACADLLGDGPVEVEATAWAARGTVSR